MTDATTHPEATDLQSFFDVYGQRVAAGDLERVADAYGYPSLVLGEAREANIPVLDRDAVIGAFAGAAESYRARGLTQALAEVVAVAEMNASILAVDVRWSYADDAGEVHERSAYRYIVRRAEGGYLIHALIEMPAA